LREAENSQQPKKFSHGKGVDGVKYAEKQFDTGVVRLNYVEGPDNGDPLVLLHGATAYWQEMMPILPTLAERWHVYALDHRGHGQSGRTPGHYALSDYIQDTIAFLDGVVGKPAFLFGHSLGGLIAMGTAAEAPDKVRALVLEDPALVVYTHRPEDISGHPYFRGTYEVLTNNRSMLGIIDWLRTLSPPGTPDEALRPNAEKLYALDPDMLLPILNDHLTEKGSFESTLERIRCPLLVLQADPILGATTEDQHVATIREHMPQAQVVQMTGAGHLIHFDQTEAVLERMIRFLEGVERGYGATATV
jgi:pimeloyl-ACP methyl ester carboxylesterase